MSSVETLSILIEKLSVIFNDEQETMARVLHYLTEEMRAYQKEEKDGPAFTMLKCMLETSGFERYARYLAEDTKTAEEDEKFKEIMGTIYSGMMDGRFSWLSQEIFNVPKNVALENAYVYFGIGKGASNHDINVAYRKKCMQHHPDKGGDSTEFHKVQIHMATIKASKEQLYS